jgi:hypothetical protein
MSEVPPQRTKAPAPVAAPVAAKPTPDTAFTTTPNETTVGRYPKFALAEDSDLESETQQRIVGRVDESRILARLDAIESLLAKHVACEANAKASMCENLETYASTVALNNALLTTSIEVIKNIQTEVNRIVWQQFETAVKPKPAEEKPAATVTGTAAESGEDKRGEVQLGGGGNNLARIETDEFVAIKDEQLLKHVWVYVSAADERAHKLRLQSLTVHDVNIIYGNGGCLFPYMKSCADWEKLDEFRLRFLVKKSYSHCRERR